MPKEVNEKPGLWDTFSIRPGDLPCVGRNGYTSNAGETGRRLGRFVLSTSSGNTWEISALNEQKSS